MRLTELTYKTLQLTFILGGTIFCSNPKNINSESDHHEHVHHEEVVLTQRQYEAFNFKIDTVSLQNIGEFVEANGEIIIPSYNQAIISAVMGGNIVSIDITEGQRVKKGEIVGYISHPNIVKLQMDYVEAYNDNIFLKKEYNRQKKLYENKVGSGMEFEKSESKYFVSKGLVNGLKTQLKLLNINPVKVQSGEIYERVPLVSVIEGFIEDINVKIGEYIGPGGVFVKVMGTDHMHVDLLVFEKDAYRIKKGQKIKFSIQTTEKKEFDTKVVSVGREFQENPKAVHVHALFDNRDKNLISGMYVKAKIFTENDRVRALPKEAVVYEDQKNYVFSVEREGDNWVFKPVEVVLGKQNEDFTEITFISEVPENTKFSHNNAYYLMADMKKEETEHEH